MSHEIFFVVEFSQADEMNQALKEGFKGLVSRETINWSGPMQKGDDVAFAGCEEPLQIKRLIHFPESVSDFETSFTEVTVEATRAVIDRLLTLGNDWDKYLL